MRMYNNAYKADRPSYPQFYRWSSTKRRLISPRVAWQTNQPFSGVPSWFGRTREQHLSVVTVA